MDDSTFNFHGDMTFHSSQPVFNAKDSEFHQTNVQATDSAALLAEIEGRLDEFAADNREQARQALQAIALLLAEQPRDKGKLERAFTYLGRLADGTQVAALISQAAVLVVRHLAP
ncbi:hypothetical protein [Hamadaea tsunoensis]|uniref:hypothetical protein n=1 Tax=Hamadaea tsunoensis TaxID=53368 RepID=UPI0004149C1B|nr:hypothetical protein [Hamadaea tsunoensis]